MADKKYYIKALEDTNPWALYYDEYQAEYDHLYVSDIYPWDNYTRAGIDLNRKEFTDLSQDIDTAMQETEDMLYDCDDIDEEEVARIVVGNILDYIPNANKLSKANLNKLINLCYDFHQEIQSSDLSYYLDSFLKILQILYNKPFISGIFRGISQSDWAYYICPESLKPSLPFIEACIMGTGTEYAICDYPLNGPEEFDMADTFGDYTELWREDDVKKWAADIIGCKPNEVEIIED